MTSAHFTGKKHRFHKSENSVFRCMKTNPTLMVTYETKPNLDKNSAIDFYILKNQEFLPLSDRLQK